MTPTQSASPTSSQWTMPERNSATIVPMHEAEQDRDPLQRRRREALDEDDEQQRAEGERRRLRSAARPRWMPPPIQPAATRISDSPMIRMTVPVTIGGKNRSSLREERREQHHEEPAGDRPNRRWRDARAADRWRSSGRRRRRCTPCISGSRTPNRQKPMDWMMVAMPATNRSAHDQVTRGRPARAARRDHAPPTISGTATAPAYIASTCCTPSGKQPPQRWHLVDGSRTGLALIQDLRQCGHLKLRSRLRSGARAEWHRAVAQSLKPSVSGAFRRCDGGVTPDRPRRA